MRQIRLLSLIASILNAPGNLVNSLRFVTEWARREHMPFNQQYGDHGLGAYNEIWHYIRCCDNDEWLYWYGRLLKAAVAYSEACYTFNSIARRVQE